MFVVWFTVTVVALTIPLQDVAPHPEPIMHPIVRQTTLTTNA